MTNIARNLYAAAAQLDSSKVRIAMFALTLVMFVVAAGAPEVARFGFIRFSPTMGFFLPR